MRVSVPIGWLKHFKSNDALWYGFANLRRVPWSEMLVSNARADATSQLGQIGQDEDFARSLADQPLGDPSLRSAPPPPASPPASPPPGSSGD